MRGALTPGIAFGAGGGGGLGGTGGDGTSLEEADPELVSLPSPPRRQRTLTLVLLALATVASCAMAAALRGDVEYALSSSSPASLGDLRATPADMLARSENRFVRAEGMLGAAGGIRYERLFAADTFRTLPVAGRGDVWVDIRVPTGTEGGRWQPPLTMTGRLVRLDDAGPRHRGLEAAIEQATHVPVPPGAWLLVDGEDPRGALWAVLLAAVFAGGAVWNGLALARLVRRVR
jgi:hypothetical protein